MSCPLCQNGPRKYHFINQVECTLSLGIGEDVEMQAPDAIDGLFIVDHLLALNRTEVLENCDALSNLVIPDTVLRYLNRKNIQAFHGIRNTMEMAHTNEEVKSGRSFYYFYNENFAETYLDE
jgi:hypothetical protein